MTESKLKKQKDRTGWGNPIFFEAEDPEIEKLITVSEMARLLQINPVRLHRLVDVALVPHPKYRIKGGRKRLFHKMDFDDLFEALKRCGEYDRKPGERSCTIQKQAAEIRRLRRFLKIG